MNPSKMSKQLSEYMTRQMEPKIQNYILFFGGIWLVTYLISDTGLKRGVNGPS